MSKALLTIAACPVLLTAMLAQQVATGGRALTLIEIDPGHSHAAQLHVEMLPGFSSEAHVYAPLGTELTAHLNAIARFNHRQVNPTHWTVNVYAGADFLEKFGKEKPGNVVVLSGRNQPKLGYILSALKAGQHVLADKPWIIESNQLPQLEAALNLADEKGLIAYDCMTQRFDAAYRLQRDLMRDPVVFGKPAVGSLDHPAVRLENQHALLKMSRGVANRRPAWYLDIAQQGEGAADVGTHLVDLVEWTLFPQQAIDYRRDIRLLKADRSAVMITPQQFQQLTGDQPWPDYLKGSLRNGELEYFANNTGTFSIRGVHVALSVRWVYEAKEGVSDSYFASYQGAHSRIELRAGADEAYVPELYLIPEAGQSRTAFVTALQATLKTLQASYPGVSVQDLGPAIHVVIPQQARTPDSGYFALLAERFLGYVRNPKTIPAWEKQNMIAKYYVTTGLVALARGKK